MKKVKNALQITACMVFFYLPILAQVNDMVRWKFTSKKISDKTYEIRFTATIDPFWHIYAQDIDENAGQPTAINFNQNPQIALEGKPQEEGKVQEKRLNGRLLKYYEGQVSFVQVVKVKTDEKMYVTGSVDYMACTETHCLPPANKKFSVALFND